MPSNFLHHLERLAHISYMATGTPHYAAKVIPSAYDFELATKLFPWAFLVYVALGIVGALLRFWSALWPRITAFFRRDGGKS